MIKKFIFISLLITASVSNANSVCQRTGAITECGQGRITNLDVAGKASLHGTTVTGDTRIAGLLRAYQADLNKLDIAGKVDLINTKVRGSARISGLLTACDSNIDQSLLISSDQTYLANTITKSIQIDAGGRDQFLYLANNSLVNGDVTFTTNHGVVVMDSTSKINGHVIGGYINHLNYKSNCKGGNEYDNR